MFRHGRAEITEEQALKLAERRYTDGILIEEQPAKEWARDRRRAENEPETVVPAEDAVEPVPGAARTRKAR
jgi:hypothetical protein